MSAIVPRRSHPFVLQVTLYDCYFLNCLPVLRYLFDYPSESGEKVISCVSPVFSFFFRFDGLSLLALLEGKDGPLQRILHWDQFQPFSIFGLIYLSFRVPLSSSPMPKTKKWPLRKGARCTILSHANWGFVSQVA